MTTEERPAPEALREAARREAEDALADPRWDALAAGTASAEEIAALTALAAAEPSVADAPRVFAPFGNDEKDRFLQAIRHTLAVSPEVALAPPPSSRRAPVVPLPLAKPTRGARFGYAAAALALAAGLGLVVLRSGGPAGPSLPGYSLVLSSEQEVRGDTTPLTGLRAGGRVVLSLRPEVALVGELTARVFVVLGGVALPVEGRAEVSADGAVRFEGKLPSALVPGAAELVVLVGRPAAVLAVSPARVPSEVDGAELRVVRSAVVLGGAP